MPYTINGCGTIYFGKKNLNKSPGTCEHCGYEGELHDYETRLFFALLFIPLIPLSKKQIIDYCPKCRRHGAIPLNEWTHYREDVLSKARSDWANQPNDPEAALALLSNLAMFHEKSGTEKLVAELEQSFPAHAEVQFYLGAWYDQQGQSARADACFKRALNLDPDSPHICRAVAIGCIEQGDLAQAKRLLQCMEKPGPHQEPATLFVLAQAYQQRNEHNEALTIFETMARLFPDLAKRDKVFRKAVLASEKTCQRPHTLLPPAPLNLKLVGVIAVILLLVGAGYGVNWYYKSHQTLYVLNRYHQPALVTVPGSGPVTVDIKGVQKINIAEGSHSLTGKLGGRDLNPESIHISNTIFERFFDNKTYVFNVGGSALILWEKTTYSTRKNGHSDDPYRLHYGKQFLTFRNIDYIFKKFPNSITIDGYKDVKKSRISVLEAEPQDLVEVMLEEVKDPAQLFPYLEGHLEDYPQNSNLLSQYVMVSALADQLDHATNFMSQHLSDRPVLIEWHRMYQEQQKTEDHDLIQEYDSLLKDEPNNSSLLYLRGRLEIMGSGGQVYYEKAISADRNNPYPWHAKAYYLLNRGDLAEAKECSQKACSLSPSTQSFKELLRNIQFALKEYKSLEREGSQLLKKFPLSTAALDLVLQSSLALGKETVAQEALTAYIKNLKSEMPDEYKEYETWCKMRWAYLKRDFKKYESLAHSIEDKETRNYFINQAALARFDVATCEKTRVPSESGPYSDLILYIGWTLKSKGGKASEALQNAVDKLTQGTQEEQIIARLLQKNDPDILTLLDELVMYPDQKRILLTALAVIYPRERRILLDRASTMNYSFTSPKFFLDSAIIKLRKI